MWSLKWGENARKVYEAASDAGVDIPESVIPPECPDHLVGYYDIFWKLSTCRNVGFSVGRIPWTAIDAFAVRYGYIEDDLLYEDLHYYIGAMDSAYTDIVNKNDETAGKDNGESAAIAARKRQEW